jgi:hypothetical protein
MELSRIKILVDKYFEGLTSLEEEQELARYFDENNDIPEEYQVVKMMLSSFDTLSRENSSCEITMPVEKRSRSRFTINMRWIATAAASIAIVLGAAFIFLTNNNSTQVASPEEPNYICYVNGVKVEDDQLAYAEANRILGSLSEDMQLAMAEVNRLTHYTIIK